jgi:hypothetical protein
MRSYNPPVESDFWAGIDIAALAEAQQVRPNEDFEALLGRHWARICWAR